MDENYERFYSSLTGINFIKQSSNNDSLGRFTYNEIEYIVKIVKCTFAYRNNSDEFRAQLSDLGLKKLKKYSSLKKKVIFTGYNKNSNTFTFFDTNFILALNYKGNKGYFTRMKVMQKASELGVSVYTDKDKKNIISLDPNNIKFYLDYLNKQPHQNYKEFEKFVLKNSYSSKELNKIPSRKESEKIISKLDDIDKDIILNRNKLAYAKDSAKKVAVEKRAMVVVREHYEKKNWKVSDVSNKRNLGFDYLIKNKKGNRKMIEVKGLQKKNSINLTLNEVNFAQENSDLGILAIVYDIQLVQISGQWQGKKGTLKVFDPVELDRSKLKPTQFSYDWITN